MTKANKTPERPKAAEARTNGSSKLRASASKLTKKSQLIQLLRHKHGASVAVISRRLGWQSHTTRAALTGLRKAGYGIVAEKRGDGKPSQYRITSDPEAAAG